MDELNPSKNNSTKEMISVLNKQEGPPILEILEYYNQSKLDIRAKLIGDENDPVNIAMQFARLAYDQTQILMPVGRGNVYQDIISSNGVSHMYTDMIRDTLKCVSLDKEGVVRNTVRDGYLEWVKQELPNHENKAQCATDLMRFMVRSHLALRYQSGACNECSVIVAQCLFEMKRKLGKDFNDVVQDIRIVKVPPTDHMFVEMDVQDKNQEKKTIICDPWACYVGTIDEVPHNLFVLGKPAREVFQSTNKVTIHDNEFLNFVCRYNSCFGETVSCFNLYYAAMIKNHKNEYCQYLKQLPDILTNDYQNTHQYPKHLGKKVPYDYETVSNETFNDLNTMYKPEDIIPPVISTISMKTLKNIDYYSQPEHPEVQYKPINKSQVYDPDIDNPINSSQVVIKDDKEVKEINNSQQVNPDNQVNDSQLNQQNPTKTNNSTI